MKKMRKEMGEREFQGKVSMGVQVSDWTLRQNIAEMVNKVPMIE